MNKSALCGVLFIALSILPADFAAAGYDACSVPPTVGIGTKPNVMILLDYSGSMQFPAYFPANLNSYYDKGVDSSHVADCDGRDTKNKQAQYKAYEKSINYYGYFNNDTYYIYSTSDSGNPYFEPASNPPTKPVKLTALSSKAENGIWFTAAGHNLHPGDVAAFYNLSSHSGVNAKNGKAFKVEEVSGDKFRINFPWNGIPDKDTGSVIKRLDGTVSQGLSGNVLNFAATSRMDAALKALTGGKAERGGDFSYLRFQGAKRYFRDSSDLQAGFFMRPGTLANPNNYETGDYYSKDIFLNIEAMSRGTLAEGDPFSVGRAADRAQGRSAEVWYFILTKPRTVHITLESTAFDSFLYLFNGKSPVSGQTYLAKDDDGAGNRNATISASLQPGTYCIEATSYGSHASYGSQGNYVLFADVDLQSDGTAYRTHNGTTSQIGSLADARLRVKIPASEKNGIVQNTFEKVRYGFMYYKGDQDRDTGKILIGCENKDPDLLTDAIQGIVPGSKHFIHPYGGTSTGEALSESYKYLAQTSSEQNSEFIQKGGTKDPYYDDGTPVPCRKGYILLVSDGQWTTGIDPVAEAAKLRRGESGSGDLRPDLDLDQFAKVFSFYSFDDSDIGKRVMRWIGMYGGFNEIQSCGADYWPFPQTEVLDGRKTKFKMAKCSGEKTDECCAEWSSNNKVAPASDADCPGCRLPDSYFEAADGKALESALMEAIGTALQNVSSGSPAVTVSQQVSEGDYIVRAAYESFDHDNPGKYIWRGHLEVYRPLSKEESATLATTQYPCAQGGSGCYDFDFVQNSGLLCKDLPNEKCSECPKTSHCWDGAKILATRLGSGKSDRRIFTGFDANSDGKISTGESIPIVEGNAKVLAPLLGVQIQSEDKSESENLIKWIKGESVDGYRRRDGWVLGDIAYSTPVVVGIPSLGTVAAKDPDVKEFWNYRNEILDEDCAALGTCKPYNKRKKMIYVGANDGMLHAFVMSVWDEVQKKWVTDPAENAEIGKESWAYIPSNVLSEMKGLANPTYGAGGCAHRYTVDLSPRAWDVYIQDPTDQFKKSWRTIIIGGERGGGDTFFAIDVTDPENPVLLWEYSVLKDAVVIDKASGSPFMPFRDCYEDVKNLPLSWSTPYVGRLNLPKNVKFYTGDPKNDKPSGELYLDDSKRNVAFMGGTIRAYSPADINAPVSEDAKSALFDPSLLAIDMETGKNLFKYVWPLLVYQNKDLFPTVVNGPNIIPYTIADPLCLDLVNSTGNSDNPDGFTDHVFFGDLNGYFYGLKIRQDISEKPFLSLNLWRTKGILNTNLFRGYHQPVTSMPAASPSADEGFVRLIFGTGKYDDINYSGSDDKSDNETMSLYNLKIPTDLNANSGKSGEIYDSGIFVQTEPKCAGTPFNTGCTWALTDGSGDCCQGNASESSCETSCWSCVYDFGNGSAVDSVSGRKTPLKGERVTGKPLISGGLVFVSTFVPSTDGSGTATRCNNSGSSYLYAFDYECAYFGEDFNPFGDNYSATMNSSVESLQNTSTTTQTQVKQSDKRFGARLSLGQGTASRPVLDSAGKQIVEQVGGDIKKVPVNLKNSTSQLKGWKIR